MSKCCKKKCGPCGPCRKLCAPCHCHEFSLTIVDYDLEAQTANILLERDNKPYAEALIGVSSIIVPPEGPHVINNTQCRSFTTDEDGLATVTYAGTGSADDQVLLSVNVRLNQCNTVACGCVKLTAILTPEILLGVSPLSYLADDLCDFNALSLYVAVERSSRLGCNANMIDHSSPGTQQGGPGKSSRALAILQIAAADAYNSIEHTFPTYSTMPSYNGGNVNVAIAQATHDVIVSLYSSRPLILALAAAYLTSELAQAASGSAKTIGITAGKRAALTILTNRAGDGSDAAGMNADYSGPTPPFVDPLSTLWSPAPPESNAGGNMQLGLLWGNVRPFALASGSQFYAPPFPTPDTVDYQYQHEEVKSVGGDGTNTLTARNNEETEIGIYWACDGTAGVGTPPRVFMILGLHVLTQQKKSPVAILQALGRIAVSMADAGIAAWETKYRYNVWRPILGVRFVNQPTNVIADPNWLCLGAPSNSNAPGCVNFTPPFPAYVSGHSTFGSALFETLRFYVGDNVEFSFVSPEYNGKTVPCGGTAPRPFKPRTFARLSQAEWENAQSRMYLGVHWQWDATEGELMGHKVAKYVNGDAVLPSAGGPATSRQPVFGPVLTE